MRRVVYEWGLIAAVAMGVAAVAVWGVSLCSAATLFHLHAWPRSTGSLHLLLRRGGPLGFAGVWTRSTGSLHLLLRRGDLWLCDGVENGHLGDVQPAIVGPPVAVDYQRGDRL